MTGRDDFRAAVDVPLVEQLIRRPAAWARGRARVDLSRNALTLDPRTVEEYVPMLLDRHQASRGEPGLLVRLANLHTREDAVGIASAYGLLRVGPGAREYSEALSVWVTTAMDIRGVLALRSALARRDKPVLEQLVAPYRPVRQKVIRRRLRVEEEAAILIAARVNTGLGKTTIGLLPGPLIVLDGIPQDAELFSYSPEFETLEGYVFNELAIHLARRVDVRTCAAPDCDRVFVPRRPGQEYHEQVCANRHRQQRRRAIR